MVSTSQVRGGIDDAAELSESELHENAVDEVRAAFASVHLCSFEFAFLMSKIDCDR